MEVHRASYVAPSILSPRDQNLPHYHAVQGTSNADRPITPPPSPHHHQQHDFSHSSPSSSSPSHRSSSPSLSLASQWDARSASSVTSVADRAVTPKPNTIADDATPTNASLDSLSERLPHERFLLISKVPKTTTDAQLKRAFSTFGDLLGIYIRYLPKNGIVILAFQDSRACLRTHVNLRESDGEGLFEGARLSSEPLTSTALRKIIGSSPFIADAEACVLVQAEAFVNGIILQEVLRKHGDVCTFQPTGHDGMRYACEFYDARHAKAAVRSLHLNSSALGVPLQVVLRPASPLHHHHDSHPSSTNASPAQANSVTTPLNFPSHHGYGYFPPTPTSPHISDVFTAEEGDANNTKQYNHEDDDDDDEVLHRVERKAVLGVRNATRFNVSPTHPQHHQQHQQQHVRRHTRISAGAPSLSSTLNKLASSTATALSQLHSKSARTTPTRGGGRPRRSSTGSAFVPGETTQFALDTFRADRRLKEIASAAAAVAATTSAASSRLFGPALPIPATSSSNIGKGKAAQHGSPYATTNLRTLGLGLGLLGLKVKETGGGLLLVEDDSTTTRPRTPARPVDDAGSSAAEESEVEREVIVESEEDEDEVLFQTSPPQKRLDYATQPQHQHNHQPHTHTSHQLYYHQQGAGMWSASSSPAAPNPHNVGYFSGLPSVYSQAGTPALTTSSNPASAYIGHPVSPAIPGHHIPSLPWATPFGWRGMGIPMPSSGGIDPAMWLRRGSVPTVSADPRIKNDRMHGMGQNGHSYGAGAVSGSGYRGSPTSPYLPHLNLQSASSSTSTPPPRMRHDTTPLPTPFRSRPTPPSPLTTHLPLNARMQQSNNTSSSSPLYRPPHRSPNANHNNGAAGSPHSPGNDLPSPRNAVDLDKIAAGLDTRTTVMIKNVPSRMTHDDMHAFVSRTCPREFDFMYLRMDFVTGNNVGYAFVNFIEVGSLLKFLKENLDKRWNLYQSEKTMYAAYATYQGKAALVTKFQNSSILDREATVQPHIYHSSGEEKGLPEPFPAPNDSARKARSLAAAQEHGLYSRLNLQSRQQMCRSMASKAAAAAAGSPVASSSPSTPTYQLRSGFSTSSNGSPAGAPNVSLASTNPSETTSGAPFGVPFFATATAATGELPLRRGVPA